MSRQIPSYLRLHVEEPPELQPTLPGRSDDALDRLCRLFRRATGWSLRCGEGPAPLESPEILWARSLAGDGETPKHLAIRRSPGKSPKDLQKNLLPLCDLLDSIADLAGQLHATRRTLIEREAELAAGVPLVSHPHEDAHLAERLQAVLRGGVEAADAQAAALYLLDEGTSRLKLRASWGLPPDRLLAPARPLRGAVADLEALTGHAVAIEDVRLLPHWKVPENFASALCVPVSTPTTPLGTLWVFGDRVRDFTARQTNMLEIVAGRIASDLERHILLSAAGDARHLRRDLDQLAALQDAQLPVSPLQTDGWDVAAACLRGKGGGNFFDWFTREDGTLAVALGGTLGCRLPAALAGQHVRGAAKSALLAGMSAERLVRHVADVLWTSTPGDEHAWLASVVLPAGGEHAEFCSAGSLGALVVRPTRPTSISQAVAPLGSDPDTDYRGGSHAVKAGDAVVLMSETVRMATDGRGQPLGDAAVADCLRLRLDQPAETLVDAVLELWRNHTADSENNPAATDATVLVARRVGR